MRIRLIYNKKSVRKLPQVVLSGILFFSSAVITDAMALDQCGDLRNVTPIVPPVALNLNGLSDNEIAQTKVGNYLVNAVGNCNSCHTSGITPSPYTATGNPFNGQGEVINANKYLAGGRVFGTAPNQVTADSLRPLAVTGKLELTLEQFLAVMKTGKDSEGKTLQTMPWPIYKNMSECDLQAIYAYLSALPILPTAEYDEDSKTVLIRDLLLGAKHYNVQLQFANNLFTVKTSKEEVKRRYPDAARYDETTQDLVIPKLLVLGKLYTATLSNTGNFVFKLGNFTEIK